jgi:opacity protein-like surface antigen
VNDKSLWIGITNLTDRRDLKMYSKRTIVVALCTAALTSFPALCQESVSYKSEVSVEGFLPVVKSTTAYGVQETTSLSGGVLAGYRFFFGTHSGVEVSYGYSRSTQSYSIGTGPLGVASNSNEVFAAYLFRFQHKRWSAYLLAGAGALLFDPRAVTGADAQARAGYLYGGGVDFDIRRRLFVRAEYRGIFYSSPTFDLNSLTGLDRFTHRAEPAVGLGYRF